MIRPRFDWEGGGELRGNGCLAWQVRPSKHESAGWNTDVELSREDGTAERTDEFEPQQGSQGGEPGNVERWAE